VQTSKGKILSLSSSLESLLSVIFTWSNSGRRGLGTGNQWRTILKHVRWRSPKRRASPEGDHKIKNCRQGKQEIKL
jgi:hypothetical protein